MSKKLVQIGMDDIDSPDGGCTTHFASSIVERLNEWNVEWVDYPNLIRLNPGIPYRTRGNGAVALRFLMDHNDMGSVIPMIEGLIHDYVDEEYPNTNPGVVFLDGQVPIQVQNISRLALWRVVPIELAKRVIAACNIPHYSSGNGRGLIGALSSVANVLNEDHTFEYIAYRSLEDCKDERGVDVKSVRAMDKTMGVRVFSNVDPTTNRIMIEPHGPDPVLFGVRGETAEFVIEAGSQVKSKQHIDRWMVFRSNQGTGEHLKHRVEIENLRPYMAAVVTGRVDNKPRMIEGGHCIFSIADDEGRIDCAAYEPSGEFRDIIMKLVTGDLVNVHAGVRPASRTHGRTLNLEGLEVVELAETSEFSNPFCPKCGKRMKSAGSGKGYKCVKCGHRDLEISKTKIPLERNLNMGLYLPPARAQRHLTRPLARIGRSNSGIPDGLTVKWHSHLQETNAQI
jgi:tRNA(Ile2)-agmatinylcytidine synthase